MKTFKDTLDAKFMVEAALPTRNKHLKYKIFLFEIFQQINASTACGQVSEDFWMYDLISNVQFAKVW